MNGADLSTVVPIAESIGENEDETRGLRRMFEEAQSFLSSFSWCEQVKESFFGFGYAGIVAVFLFRIRPSRPHIDDWLWVNVGDLPPACLVTEGNLTPDLAVDGYISEMRRWAKAVNEGRSVKALIPVNVAPTLENAEKLERRLNALRKIIRDTLMPRESKQISSEVQ